MTNELHDESCLRANARDVASKVVDGEAILINLVNGLYYSMDKVSGFIWSLIANGSSVDRMVSAVSAHYTVPEAQARADVQRLVRELLAENLITVGDDALPAPAGEASDLPPQPYETPVLARYDDMADMFALDPPLPELPPIPPGDRA